MLKFFVIFCVLLISVDAQMPCFNLFATSEFITSEVITTIHTCCSIDTVCILGKRKKKRYIAIDDELDINYFDMKKPYNNDTVKVIEADNVHPTKRLTTVDVKLESSIPDQRKPGLREGRFKFYWWTTTSTSSSTYSTTYTISCTVSSMCNKYGVCS